MSHGGSISLTDSPCNLSSVLCLVVDRDPALEIGLLDIFGFEEFQKNSFEQVGGHTSLSRK